MENEPILDTAVLDTATAEITEAWNNDEPDQHDEVTTEEPATETPATEVPATEEPPSTTVPPVDPPAESTPTESFQLKHMDETRIVSRDEVVTLAQKGIDYDRIREERDQLKTYKGEVDPAYSIVKSFAEKSGMNVSEYVDFCRKQELIGQGISEENASAQVAIEKHKAAADSILAEQAARKQQEDSERLAVQKKEEARQKDFSDFVAKYPTIKAEDISQDVWDMVKNGQSLVSAYTMKLNQQLSADLAAERKNKENAQRSPGSMENPGEGETADQIKRYWNEAD